MQGVREMKESKVKEEGEEERAKQRRWKGEEERSKRRGRVEVVPFVSFVPEGMVVELGVVSW